MPRPDWLHDLPHGLPDDFDFDVIQDVDDVGRMLCALPNRDRGRAARVIYERRARVGKVMAYAALIETWEHDYGVAIEAFGSMEEFAEALRDVAPPIRRRRPLRVWRGICVREADPGEAAIGLSWTRSRDIACWFACRYNFAGTRPFVFTTVLMPPGEIIALHDGRGEQEVLVDPEALLLGNIDIDGTSISRQELAPNDSAPADALAGWRAAGERYEARKAERQARELRAIQKRSRKK